MALGKRRMVNICPTGHSKWQFLFCVERPTRLTVGSLGLQVFASIFIPRSTGCRVGSLPPQAPAPIGPRTGLGSAGWLELGVSLVPLWVQERWRRIWARSLREGDSRRWEGWTLNKPIVRDPERAWEQAAAQRPGERSQASRAGGAASEAEGGKDTATRRRPGA